MNDAPKPPPAPVQVTIVELLVFGLLMPCDSPKGKAIARQCRDELFRRDYGNVFNFGSAG